MTIYKIISLFLVGVVGVLVLGLTYDHSKEYEKIRQNIARVNAGRVERAKQELAKREFDNRVQTEAKKQGVVQDSSRVDAISLIVARFGNDARTAVAVFRAESGLRCGVISSTGDYGIAQINQVHKWRFKGSMLDCAENINVAYQIFKEQGWNPWSAFKNGHYLSFL